MEKIVVSPSGALSELESGKKSPEVYRTLSTRDPHFIAPRDALNPY